LRVEQAFSCGSTRTVEIKTHSADEFIVHAYVSSAISDCGYDTWGGNGLQRCLGQIVGRR
jgi:hypothetical protein